MMAIPATESRSEGRRPAGRLGGAPLIQWERPTLGEFVAQIEHRFGSTADPAVLLALGLGRSDTLAPADIRLLCSEIGVPPEDFGVEP